MVNVTAPVNAGYRFSPPGQRFKKAVTIRLPYDASLLPEGTPPEQVQTFYFDKGEKQWKPLTRKQVLRATQQVESETTHFTFMINAVLVLPDHPGPVSFDPNSIKDLKAADPSAKVVLLEPPEGNYEWARPAGPGSGAAGCPWRVRSVAAARLRLGRRQRLDGRGLGRRRSPASRWTRASARPSTMAPSASCWMASSSSRWGRARAWTAARASASRRAVERSFRRVVRCGEGSGGGPLRGGPAGWRAAPLRRHGGRAPADPAMPSRIGQWMLERVVDVARQPHAYRYTADHREGPGTGFDEDNHEAFTQRYPREILYSGKVDRADAALPELDAFLAAAEMGPYLVQLELGARRCRLLERPDIQINGRMGFKIVTRYRLGRVKVRLNTSQDDTVIREYRFTYERGDFGKSRLKQVEQFGVGGVAAGALFHCAYAGVPERATTGARVPSRRW